MSERIGLVAGFGALPELFARNVGADRLVVAGFTGITPRRLSRHAAVFRLFPVGKLGDLLEYFVGQKVDRVVFLGYVPHTMLVAKRYTLDGAACRMFSRLQANTAMQVFAGLEMEFRKRGVSIATPHEFLGDHFAAEGLMAGPPPDDDMRADIRFGYAVARGIAALDVGLTAVVKNRVAVAVEGLEGTEQCIRRGRRLAGPGICVVKVGRPGQDPRFDLPVIGLRTVGVLRAVHAKALAVESAVTLILDKTAVIARMNAAGICLYGIARS